MFCRMFSLLSIVAVSPMAYGDWPEFRGPTQNGHCDIDGLPVRWSESENVVWFAKTTGLGWSSPIVVGHRIYFTSAISAQEGVNESVALEGRQRLVLSCLDARDGKELFRKTIFEQPEDAPKIHNKNSHASPTPVVDGDRIYVHFGHQGTACTDLNGNKIWENKDHAFPPTHGNGGSPILAGDNLIVTCDGGKSPYTLALNKSTGKEAWKRLRDVPADKPFSFCTPQLIEIAGQKQVISPGTNVVQAISPEDGQVLWFVRYDGYSVVPRPVYHRGLVLVCTGFGNTKILAIDPSGKGDVTDTHVQWTFGTSVPKSPSLACIGDQAIMTSDDGIAAAIDIKSGKQLWKQRIGGNYSSSPLVAGDHIYFQSEQGDSSVYKLGSELTEIARNKLPGRIFASYSVIDRDLIIRAEQGIYRIGSR
jgi:outer membrane protein assembly factor BamB